MAGIRAFGAYVPRYRLGKETVGWNGRVEKAVCNFDEDSVTMAVAAAVDCVRGLDRSKIDALIFATTSSPYVEKQGASTIAEALDLRKDIFTTDVTGVLRAGTGGLRSALDSVKAGSAKQVLVVASDSRPTLPRSSLEATTGDGAAALLVTGGKTPIEIEHSFFVSEHMLDTWRPEGEAFVRSAEDRFVLEEGYQRIMTQAANQFFQKQKVEPQGFSKAVYYAPDARRHQDMGRRLGFSIDQVQDPLLGRMGNTGAAFSLMLLVAALEEAEPGQNIFLASYGDGADIFSLKTGEGIRRAKRGLGMKGHLESKRVLGNYETYTKWRNLWTSEGARRPDERMPSPSALWRETDQNVRLYGSRCNNCQYLQYPPQRVCIGCSAKDDYTMVRFSDKKAKVFTYSMDYLAGTVDVPLVVAVVNFDGGGRMLTMMTDRELDEVKIDMPVEMSFRKLRSAGGVHNYYWKTVPIRGANNFRKEQTK